MPTAWVNFPERLAILVPKEILKTPVESSRVVYPLKMQSKPPGRATEAQRAAIEQLNSLAQASGTNMAAILRCLSISHQMHASQAQDIANVQRQFITLSEQQKKRPLLLSGLISYV